MLRAEFDAVPEGIRNRPPAPGQWSPVGIVEHLAIANRRIAKMITRRTRARDEHRSDPRGHRHQPHRRARDASRRAGGAASNRSRRRCGMGRARTVHGRGPRGDCEGRRPGTLGGVVPASSVRRVVALLLDRVRWRARSAARSANPRMLGRHLDRRAIRAKNAVAETVGQAFSASAKATADPASRPYRAALHDSATRSYGSGSALQPSALLSLSALMELRLDPRVGYEPDQRHRHVDRI
jgi:hypothetical protein